LLKALTSMKTAARPAVSHLLARLDELNLPNQLPVVRTMLEIGAEPDEMAPVLVSLLKRASSAGRKEPRGNRVLPGQSSEHGSRLVCDAAGELLARVSPEAAQHQVSKMIPLLVQDGTVDRTVFFAVH